MLNLEEKKKNRKQKRKLLESSSDESQSQDSDEIYITQPPKVRKKDVDSPTKQITKIRAAVFKAYQEQLEEQTQQLATQNKEIQNLQSALIEARQSNRSLQDKLNIQQEINKKLLALLESRNSGLDNASLVTETHATGSNLVTSLEKHGYLSKNTKKVRFIEKDHNCSKNPGLTQKK